MKTQIALVLIFFFTLSQLTAQNCKLAEYNLNTTAGDSSGNDYHGKLLGPISTEDRFGEEDGAFLFDGVND